VISGHWEEKNFTVQKTRPLPCCLITAGFPAHTYELTWPVPGDPALVDRVALMLGEAGLPTDKEINRGLDYGFLFSGNVVAVERPFSLPALCNIAKAVENLAQFFAALGQAIGDSGRDGFRLLSPYHPGGL